MCIWENCSEPIYSRKLCNRHYNTATRRGILDQFPLKGNKAKPSTRIKHIMSNVDETSRTGVCSECGPTRVSRSRYKENFYYHCASPNREYRKNAKKRARSVFLVQAYGMTLDEYSAMNEAQGGVCKICYNPETAVGKILAVDHDHITGSVRGLLCMRCNTALGMFGDSPSLLISAIEYLNAT